LTESDFNFKSDVIECDPDMDCDVPDCGFDYERAVSQFEWNLLGMSIEPRSRVRLR